MSDYRMDEKPFLGINLGTILKRSSTFPQLHPRLRGGLNRGVQKEVYSAGLTFLPPFGLQRLYRLPKGIQVLELTNINRLIETLGVGKSLSGGQMTQR